jgi:ubiquinone/menaquinone biosynthesis C-methylase UbiE
MTTDEIDAALTAFDIHLERYRQAGHDRLQAVRFVVDAAGPWTGPALDVGTGKGLLAIALARRAGRVTTIDTSADEQQIARARALREGLADRITFVTGDAASLPFPDAAFGLVAMMNVLHHLASPSPVLDEMVRVLAPGGHLLIGEFDQQGFDLVARIHREEGRVHPVGPVTMAAAHRRLLSLGLRLVKRLDGMLHEVALFEAASA